MMEKMRIPVLNGSPHLISAAADMSAASEKSEKEAGHKALICDVAHMNIKGCPVCEYFHNKEKGKYVQQDDMQRLYHDLLPADVAAFASQICSFTLSAQIQAVISRTCAPVSRKM